MANLDVMKKVHQELIDKADELKQQRSIILKEAEEIHAKYLMQRYDFRVGSVVEAAKGMFNEDETQIFKVTHYDTGVFAGTVKFFGVPQKKNGKFGIAKRQIRNIKKVIRK